MKWQLKGKPQVLIIALGANDGLRGIPVQASQENLEKLIQFSKNQKLKILLVGMLLPQNYGKDYRSQFQKVFENLAKKHQLDFMPFLLKDVARRKELNLEDGIHPNEKGHEIMAANLIPYLEKLL